MTAAPITPANPSAGGSGASGARLSPENAWRADEPRPLEESNLPLPLLPKVLQPALSGKIQGSPSREESQDMSQKLTFIALLTSLSAAPLRTCRSLHHCCLCEKDITLDQMYRDRGYGKRAHLPCVTDSFKRV